MRIKDFISLLVASAKSWHTSKASRLGAALAYYAIFSIAPLALFAVLIAGAFFGEAAAEGRISAFFADAIGPQGAQFVESMIAGASDFGAGGSATIAGSILLLYGASNFFHHLRGSLNTIWRVEDKDVGAVRGFVRDRILSIIFIPLIGATTSILLAASALLGSFDAVVGKVFGAGGGMVASLNIIVFALLATVLIAMLYKLLPAAHIRWSDVWVGAAVTAGLLIIGNSLIGFYIRRSSLLSTYGAAGSLVVLLLWIYYSAQVFFYGAEFTHQYANKYGSRIVSNHKKRQ